MLASPRSDIHNMVSLHHRILVVLHNDQCISQIPEVFQCFEQLIVILLMKADAGLIQNIGHTHKSGANLGRQTDTLCFTAG